MFYHDKYRNKNVRNSVISIRARYARNELLLLQNVSARVWHCTERPATAVVGSNGLIGHATLQSLHYSHIKIFQWSHKSWSSAEARLTVTPDKMLHSTDGNRMIRIYKCVCNHKDLGF